MGLLKKITRPISKVLDKVIPNEIKPALPFIAAAGIPLGFASGLGSFLAPTLSSTLQGAIGSGILNLGAQASQEGFDKRGLNLGSLGLASLGGALAAPGAGEILRGGQVLGVDELGQAITRSQAMPYLEANYPGLDFSTTNLTGQGAQYGLPVTEASTSFLDKAQNLIAETAAKGADVFKAGQQALEPGGAGLFSKEFLTAAVPGQIGAVADKAYAAAQDAKIKYDEQMAQVGQTVAKSKADQIYYIRQAMQQAGFNDDEISSALTRSGFADGGSSNKPQPMPMNPELLAVALFGKRLDELTYTEKNALRDYIDVPKKAKGGLMDLAGHEMDFRARGGFVPIGKKERADDVPARLSKNEFVFTAKAVRNAGDGDIKKGAKKMYQIMKQLEARA